MVLSRGTLCRKIQDYWHWINNMKNILIYLPHHTLAMSACLIKDLFWVASSYASANLNNQRDAQTDPGQHIQLVSVDGQAVHCSSGNQLSVDLSLSEAGKKVQVDLIVLCAFWGAPKTILEQNQALVPFLQEAHEKNIPLAGFSNGQFFMAQAGLLDKKEATIYPLVQSAFQKNFPHVNLNMEKAITNAGNLYCSNGIPSSCDLIVAMIEKLYGAKIAHQISKEFLIGFERNYNLSNIEFDGQKYHGHKDILAIQVRLEQDYGQAISIEGLAAEFNMSPRNFSRRFKQATGESPSQYLQRVRMEAAKELLHDPDMSISQIAYQVGYDDLSYFSRLFNRYTGALPQAYRDDILLMPSQY